MTFNIKPFDWFGESERLRKEVTPSYESMTREPILVEACRKYYETIIYELVETLDKYKEHKALTEKIKKNIEELGTVKMLKGVNDDI